MIDLFTIALILVIIGAINWGFVGATKTDLVKWANKKTIKNDWVERLIYMIIAIAAFYLIYDMFFGK